MSNHLIPQDYPADDGWNDAADEASERMIRGSLLKFADWRWTTGKEGTRVPDGTRLVALATAAAWNRWEDGKIAETRVRRPGERMPEREDLGYTDEDQWETNVNDEAQDPWANTRYVYLVDLTPAAEVYTFATSSWGGREAVVELGDAIQRMRKARPDACPIVELQAKEKPTKYGKKSRPVLRVVGWKTASDEGSSGAIDGPEGTGGGGKAAIVERLMPAAEVRQAERQVRDQEIDEDIPF
jgi:hypothetical protein